MTRHASTSLPGQKVLNHLCLARLMLNKLAGSKLFGSTCNLLASCEIMREAAQIFLTRHTSTSVPGQKLLNHLFEKIVGDMWFKGLLGQHTG